MKSILLFINRMVTGRLWNIRNIRKNDQLINLVLEQSDFVFWIIVTYRIPGINLLYLFTYVPEWPLGDPLEDPKHPFKQSIHKFRVEPIRVFFFPKLVLLIFSICLDGICYHSLITKVTSYFRNDFNIVSQ